MEIIHQTHEGVLAVQGHTITAGNSGYATVRARLNQGEVTINGERHRRVQGVYVASIHVINEATMTHITTAQELADISKNLSGHFILMNDIDLYGIDWQPIGSTEREYIGGGITRGVAFSGMFVNPREFIVDNLTINSSENLLMTGIGGLFSRITQAFIYGIILENVFIDVSDASGYISWAGGIAGWATSSIIINCRVEGYIFAQIYAGGIVGADDWGIYINCEFSGIVKANQISNHALRSRNSAAGGIVGYLGIWSRLDRNLGIFDSRVNATIIATNFAGGIAGFVLGDVFPINSTFEGYLYGDNGQGEMFGFSRFQLSQNL